MSYNSEHWPSNSGPGPGPRPRGSLVPSPILQSYPSIESFISPSWDRETATLSSNSTSSKPSPLTAFPSHKAAWDSMQNWPMRTKHGRAGPEGFKEWHNDPTKKQQHVAAHCKICSYSEHNLSWIDQLVFRGDSTLKNILINLEKCDEPLLEYFYGSAFERLDANASANILGRWIEAMSSEVWLGIMNAHLKESPSHDPRDILYHILCGNHGEKLPFKRLLEALCFVRIEESDREGVEMCLLLCEIEMWRKLDH